jgi:hypothetical protein
MDVSAKGMIYKLGPSFKNATVPVQLISDFQIRALQAILGQHEVDEQESIAVLWESHGQTFGDLPR